MSETRSLRLWRRAASLVCLVGLSFAPLLAAAQDSAPAEAAFPLDEDGEVRVLGVPGTGTLIVAELAWHGGCLLGNARLLVLGESGSSVFVDSPALVRSPDSAHAYLVALSPASLGEDGADSVARDDLTPDQLALSFEDDFTGVVRVGELMRLDLATLVVESVGIPAGGSLVVAGGAVYTAPGTCAAPADAIWRPLDPATNTWGDPAPLPGEWPGPGLFGDSADPTIERRYAAEASSFETTGTIWPPEGTPGPWRLDVRVDDAGSRVLVLSAQ